jgi:hypothetical protein
VPSSAEPPAERSIDAPSQHAPGPEHLATSLLDDLAAGRPEDEVVPAGDTPGAPASESVTVAVDAESTNAAVVAVEASGGVVTVRLDGVVQADVPAARLADLAGAPGVRSVREPLRATPSVTSQGVASTGASAWHSAGDGGAGTKIAVVDGGFAGAAALVGTELPVGTTMDLSRCSDPNQEVHGTAVAEIAHDMAPAAALHLVCIETDLEFVDALSTFSSLGVDIVNGSIGWTLTGRGDGSGGPNTVAGAVRALREQNILYVGSAGNYSRLHWMGPAVGDTANAPGDFVDIAPDDGLDFLVAPNATVTVSMRWDAWPETFEDLDLLVYDMQSTCNNEYGIVNDVEVVDGVAYLSEGGWTQDPGQPVEQVTFTNCRNSVGFFEVLVDRFQGGAAPRIDLFFDGDIVLMSGTESSVVEPATSPAVLAVGAHCTGTSQIEGFSSTGPTIDGRTKPDIAAPDSVSTATYGNANVCQSGFVGTSAAAPHVAGAAAVLLGANPSLDVAELQQLLLDRALDAGGFGDDNQFGAGVLAMGPARSVSTPPPAALTAVAPQRLYDTRPGQIGVGESPDRAAPVGAGQFLEVQIRGIAGIPNDAVAVVLNVTATQPTAAGYLSVQPGTNPPTTSNLNFQPGETSAQHVTATIGPDGRVRIFNAAGTAHVVVDVSGWYGPSSAPAVPATARFSTLPAPARAYDSRPPGGGQQFAGYAEVPPRTTPLASGEAVDVELDLPGGVPSGATAAVVNLTVTGASSGGWITTFPTGSAEPSTSSINFAAGQTVANLLVAPLDANGRLRLRASGGPVHVIVDTIGWFQPDVGAGYIALDPPRRQLDTRFGNGSPVAPVAPGAIQQVQAGRYHGVPLDAEAVALGVVAVTPTSAGWLTAFPTGQAQPLASNLNFGPGSIVPNAVIAGLGTDGRVSIANSHGLTHVISDVFGYFLDPADVPVPPT